MSMPWPSVLPNDYRQEDRQLLESLQKQPQNHYPNGMPHLEWQSVSSGLIPLSDKRLYQANIPEAQPVVEPSPSIQYGPSFFSILGPQPPQVLPSLYIPPKSTEKSETLQLWQQQFYPPGLYDPQATLSPQASAPYNQKTIQPAYAVQYEGASQSFSVPPVTSVPVSFLSLLP
jgi:hypothetical protein